MGKTSKESLKRRITLFDVAQLKIMAAQKAKNKINKFELDFIRDVSSGAATFYVWVNMMGTFTASTPNKVCRIQSYSGKNIDDEITYFGRGEPFCQLHFASCIFFSNR